MYPFYSYFKIPTSDNMRGRGVGHRILGKSKLKGVRGDEVPPQRWDEWSNWAKLDITLLFDIC